MKPNLLPQLKSCRLMLLAYLGYRDKIAARDMNGPVAPFTELLDLIRDTEAAIAIAEDRGDARSYRIRRCNGNRAAWLLVALRPDGTEIESHGASITALSLDALVALSPLNPRDEVEFMP